MSAEKEDLEREAFEAWYARTYLPTPVRGRTFRKYSTGVYCLQHAQDAWQAWCAAKSHADKSEWISVDDRLPETETTVLICTKRGDIFSSWASNEDVFWFYGEEGDNRVTHWQPLPALPEQGDK